MSVHVPLYTRPTQERSRVRFDTFVDSVRQELGHCGIIDLNLAEFAKRSGIGIHTLYRYFPDVTGVFAYFLEEISRELETSLDEFIFHCRTSKNWEKDVALFIKFFGLGVVERPFFTKTLMVCRIDPVLENYWWQMVGALEKQLADWLRLVGYKTYGVPVSDMTRFIVVQINGLVLDIARANNNDAMRSIRQVQKGLISRLRQHLPAVAVST